MLPQIRRCYDVEQTARFRLKHAKTLNQSLIFMNYIFIFGKNQRITTNIFGVFFKQNSIHITKRRLTHAVQHLLQLLAPCHQHFNISLAHKQFGSMCIISVLFCLFFINIFTSTSHLTSTIKCSFHLLYHSFLCVLATMSFGLN